MQKRNVLQASESQISTAPKNGRQKKPIRKKKKASIEWGRLFRVAMFTFISRNHCFSLLFIHRKSTSKLLSDDLDEL